MFWLAYLFTVIVGGTFAVILRVLRKVLRSWLRVRTGYQKAPNLLAVTSRLTDIYLARVVFCLPTIYPEPQGERDRTRLTKHYAQ